MAGCLIASGLAAATRTLRAAARARSLLYAGTTAGLIRRHRRRSSARFHVGRSRISKHRERCNGLRRLLASIILRQCSDIFSRQRFGNDRHLLGRIVVATAAAPLIERRLQVFCVVNGTLQGAIGCRYQILQTNRQIALAASTCGSIRSARHISTIKEA